MLCPDLSPELQRARDIIDPLFMFVYGKSFEELDAQRPYEFEYLGRWGATTLRKPWSPDHVKQTWREPGERRGKRSGGRKHGRHA